MLRLLIIRNISLGPLVTKQYKTLKIFEGSVLDAEVLRLDPGQKEHLGHLHEDYLFNKVAFIILSASTTEASHTGLMRQLNFIQSVLNQ